MPDVFQDPKVGDPVALYPYMRERPVRFEITAVTATQVVVGGRRFKRRDGIEIGGGYSKAHCAPWTAEVDRRILEMDARDANAAAVEALYKRLSAAVEVAKFTPRGGTRKWVGDDLARLEAFVSGVEARVADLVGSVTGTTP